MGFRIFQHSVQLVFRQWRDALAISGLLYALTSIVGLLVTLNYPATMVDGQLTPSLPMIAASFFAALIYLWIAVAWHRFVLLDEMPTFWLPRLHGDRALAYIGRSIQLGLLGGLAGLVYALVTVGIGALLGPASVIIAGIGGVVLVVFLVLLSYRLAPIFPGAAVQRSVGVKAAWQATAGANWSFVGLAVLSVLGSIIIDLPALIFELTPSIKQIGNFIWLSITGWVKLMVGVSILTTIYGVYVEKRAIA